MRIESNTAHLPYGGISDPQVLRDLYEVRFKHFWDMDGRLVGTIATEPMLDVVDDSGQPLIACAAAIVFSGADPLRGILLEIEDAIRASDAQTAANLCAHAVYMVEGGLVRAPDAPSRVMGRTVALGRLDGKDVVLMTCDELKRQITDRTILQNFPGGAKLLLRPRAKFVPRSRR